MGDKTKIEWTDATWNPIWGCSRISEGCRHCYAEQVAARFSGPGQTYEGLAHRVGGEGRWTGKLKLAEHKLTEPLRWRRPRRIFVNSMSDLFHEAVPDEWIDKVFAVMALVPQHTFQVLTKRADRMRAYMDKSLGRIADAVQPLRTDNNRVVGPLPHIQPGKAWWPLANVWLGVSVEDQAAADERIPHLLATPASVRFLSCEPLIGEVDISNWLFPFKPCANCPCPDPEVSRDGFEECCKDPELLPSPIDWVIAGGESGRGARPAHPDWFRTLRDQCAAAGVPFFFKQWGAWMPDTLEEAIFRKPRSRGTIMWPDGKMPDEADLPAMMNGTFNDAGSQHLSFVGKDIAGRLLDGVEHSDFPKGSP